MGPAFNRGVDAIADRLDPQWREDFKRYIQTGECSDGFKHYIQTDPDVESVLDNALSIMISGICKPSTDTLTGLDGE